MSKGLCASLEFLVLHGAVAAVAVMDAGSAASLEFLMLLFAVAAVYEARCGMRSSSWPAMSADRIMKLDVECRAPCGR